MQQRIFCHVFHKKTRTKEKHSQAQNIEIFHQLQFSLTNVSLSSLGLLNHHTKMQADNLLPLY